MNQDKLKSTLDDILAYMTQLNAELAEAEEALGAVGDKLDLACSALESVNNELGE